MIDVINNDNKESFSDPIEITDAPNINVKKKMPPIFGYKNKCWGNESEYRVISEVATLQDRGDRDGRLGIVTTMQSWNHFSTRRKRNLFITQSLEHDVEYI